MCALFFFFFFFFFFSSKKEEEKGGREKERGGSPGGIRCGYNDEGWARLDRVEGGGDVARWDGRRENVARTPRDSSQSSDWSAGGRWERRRGTRSGKGEGQQAVLDGVSWSDGTSHVTCRRDAARALHAAHERRRGPRPALLLLQVHSCQRVSGKRMLRPDIPDPGTDREIYVRAHTNGQKRWVTDRLIGSLLLQPGKSNVSREWRIRKEVFSREIYLGFLRLYVSSLFFFDCSQKNFEIGERAKNIRDKRCQQDRARSRESPLVDVGSPTKADS